jgi:hypothetical protein
MCLIVQEHVEYESDYINLRYVHLVLFCTTLERTLPETARPNKDLYKTTSNLA